MLLRRILLMGTLALCAVSLALSQDASSSSSTSSSHKHVKKSGAGTFGLDAGSVTGNIYRNRELGLTYKIPEGWVLRTDEMNARDDAGSDEEAQNAAAASSAGAQVLLAAFLRPPLARGEEVNSSVLIAAERQDAYPGLTEAVQYFGPLTEVAKAQGFSQDEEPSELDIGNKMLIRVDYHKDVATRVMRQSTLAFLSHGYAISITVIGGTEDEVEELIEGLSFSPSGK